MARRRMLDPEFFFDEELAETENSAYVRLFYQGLWCHCDDIHHTVPNKPGWLKAQIFPYEDVDVVPLWSELVRIGKVKEFDSENGNPFGWLKNFGKHQRIEKPSKSKYPAFPEAPVVVGEDSGSPPAKVKRSKEKISKYDSLFDRLWKEYPKKVGKEDARTGFYKLEPTEELTDQIISAIGRSKKTPQWQDSDGRYIPHMSTYLNQKRYLDEVEESKGPKIVDWELTPEGKMRPIFEKTSKELPV